MAKTPEELAQKYLDKTYELDPDWPAELQGDKLPDRLAAEPAFLAGYQACINENTFISIREPTREILRISPTATGIDVIIPKDVTMTEAAEIFIRTVKGLLPTP